MQITFGTKRIYVKVSVLVLKHLYKAKILSIGAMLVTSVHLTFRFVSPFLINSSDLYDAQ